MEDAQIIDHFFRRDPEALRAAQEKYEKRCLAAARHILPDARDAEECVSDVWLRLWNAIPPERPRSLAAYITTVTRRLALDKCDYNRAAQRRSDLTVAFEELEGCLPAEDGAVRALAGPVGPVEAVGLRIKMDAFHALPPLSCRTGSRKRLFAFSSVSSDSS